MPLLSSRRSNNCKFSHAKADIQAARTAMQTGAPAVAAAPEEWTEDWWTPDPSHYSSCGSEWPEYDAQSDWDVVYPEEEDDSQYPVDEMYQYDTTNPDYVAPEDIDIQYSACAAADGAHYESDGTAYDDDEEAAQDCAYAQEVSDAETAYEDDE